MSEKETEKGRSANMVNNPDYCANPHLKYGNTYDYMVLGGGVYNPKDGKVYNLGPFLDLEHY